MGEGKVNYREETRKSNKLLVTGEYVFDTATGSASGL